MAELTKQILLKISPELDDLIDRGLSLRLKEFGEPISKSEFIRQILISACPNMNLRKCLHLVCSRILTKETASILTVHLNEFGLNRVEAEIIFNELVKKHQVAEWYNSSQDVIGNFQFDKIENLAKNDISLEIREFIAKVFRNRYPLFLFLEMEKERYEHLIPALEESFLIQKFGSKKNEYDFSAYAERLFNQKGA